jgi:ubiquinol-cytochrome c reductase cytochrome c subunit
MSAARRALRRLRAPLAVTCGAIALTSVAAPAPSPLPAMSRAQNEPARLLGSADRAPLLATGRRLFGDTCSSCHGADARGIAGRGPSLRGVGELAADFYLRTNRMPLDDPEDQPSRHPSSPLTTQQKRALVAYVGSFGGPPIPEVRAARGRVAEGLHVFTEQCAGCHQVAARGGEVPRAQIPNLQQSTAIDIAEAVDIGPYVMPRFRSLSDQQVDSLARYIAYTKDPEDRGGWGIGHIGPIPEGMVTWLLAACALLLTIRIIGERTT